MKQPYGVMVAQMILVHLVGVRISVGLPFAFKKSLVIKQKPDLENKFSALAFLFITLLCAGFANPQRFLGELPCAAGLMFSYYAYASNARARRFFCGFFCLKYL